MGWGGGRGAGGPGEGGGVISTMRCMHGNLYDTTKRVFWALLRLFYDTVTHA